MRAAPARPSLASALTAVVLAGALAAAVLGGIRTWDRLGDARVHLSASEAERAAAVHEGLPVAVFDRFRARVSAGDTWWLDLPRGAPVGLTTRDAVYRAYAVYWLLPAVPADSAQDATAVFRLTSLP